MARSKATGSELSPADKTTPEVSGIETVQSEPPSPQPSNANKTVEAPAAPLIAPLVTPPVSHDQPGLVTILSSSGSEYRHVHPVDVAEWLALGWQVLPADDKGI